MPFSFDYWVVLGLLGQLIFFMRFVVQWLYAEKKKRSVIPVAFWYISIVGGAMVLAYALHRQDIVFIIGQSAALLIYLRNIQLARQTTADEQPL